MRRPPRLAPAIPATAGTLQSLPPSATSSTPAGFDAHAHPQPSPAARVSGAAAPPTPASSTHPPSSSYLSPSPCLISGRVFSSRCAEKWEMNKSQIQYASMPWTLYERRLRKATASVLGREKMTWSSSACSSACKKLCLVYRNGCILFILQDL